MILCAPCKINLTLDVFDKKARTDGYHNLDSIVVQCHDLADQLTIRVEPVPDRTSIKITCNNPLLPVDHRNLAYRAAEAFLGRLSESFHVEIDLHKYIPIQAGLGGGSSNAAAVLRALNAHFEEKLDHTALMALAASLGSDVPLFMSDTAHVKRNMHLTNKVLKLTSKNALNANLTKYIEICFVNWR